MICRFSTATTASVGGLNREFRVWALGLWVESLGFRVYPKGPKDPINWMLEFGIAVW